MSVQASASSPPTSAIRWVRVLLAAFFAEVALIGVAVPLYFTPNPMATLNLAIPPASFLAFIAFGYWAARGGQRAWVLNGFLAGLAAVLLYIGLAVGAAAATHRDLWASFTPAYLLAHALKMAGGALGGLLAARRRAAAG